MVYVGVYRIEYKLTIDERRFFRVESDSTSMSLFQTFTPRIESRKLISFMDGGIYIEKQPKRRWPTLAVCTLSYFVVLFENASLYYRGSHGGDFHCAYKAPERIQHWVGVFCEVE